ncbi:Di-copper centre-containing protein [Neoconidiobolus thromboides FSU 785]|nr:Di-copper centre-containing protein [Neoconidiobolus thromboides FSU 785]
MIFNLKAVSLIILGIATSVVGQDLPFCKPENIRVRKNIKQMSDSQLTRYFNAVKQLNSGPRPTKWDSFAKMHIEYYPQVHMRPLFYVWHQLQKIDPSVTIPYWDWTSEASNPNSDPIYSEKYFGRVNGNDGCVDSGPFKDFKVFYYHGGNGGEHCLRRKKVFDEKVTGAAEMDNLYLNDTPFSRFAGNIEGLPHGRIHNGIGGEFSGHASPGDPLFYSHHAFIDKLWFDHQMRYPETMDEYHISRRTPVAPWGFPVLQGIDTSDRMCYVYKQEHFSWVKPGGVSRAAFIPDFTPEPYTVPTNVTTLEDLVKHDVAFVTKNFELADNGITKIMQSDRSLLSSAPEKPPVKLLDADFIMKMQFNYSNIRENEMRELEFNNFMKETGGAL